VLDTAGINVWCAAGKGTFGSENLARAIVASGLAQVVSQRQVIVPQLGAPGVAAHQVKRLTGFAVRFGPVAARDLPGYLARGQNAPAYMRRKDFPWRERAVLIPMELVAALKWGLLIAAGLALLGGLGSGPFLDNLARHGLAAAAVIVAAALAGSVAGPLLLPWLPGRAFAAKGLWLGLASGLLLWALGRPGWLEGLGWLGMATALCAFLVMNFTGASTYTSLSGVKKEMRWAVPLEIALGALGLVAWLASRFLA
jgi:acetyl-CoA decarbonylase/synthase complex subunit gamma